MLIQYKEFSANLIYSPATKSFYGEILDLEQFIAFQATSHKEAVIAMQFAVDAYLQPSAVVWPSAAIPEV